MTNTSGIDERIMNFLECRFTDNMYLINIYKQIEKVNGMKRQLYGLPAKRVEIYDEKKTVDENDIVENEPLETERKEELTKLWYLVYNFGKNSTRDLPLLDLSKGFRDDNSGAFIARLSHYLVVDYFDSRQKTVLGLSQLLLNAFSDTFNYWLDAYLDPLIAFNIEYARIRRAIVNRFITILEAHNLPAMTSNGGFYARSYKLRTIWLHPFPTYTTFLELLVDITKMIPNFNAVAREACQTNLLKASMRYQDLERYDEQGRTIFHIYEKSEFEKKWNEIPREGVELIMHDF